MFSVKKHTHAGFIIPAVASGALVIGVAYSPLPAIGASNDVTISNGGLSVTFNVAWGAVVTGIANNNVANGLNIVDSHDVGRELQTDQFLSQNIGGSSQLMINPTQAGAGGNQAYYQHPNGSQFPEVGSPVVSWSATANQFQAVITPLDYDTGNPTDWVYVENVSINSQGVANFHYTSYDYQPGTYQISTEIPVLYSDYTDAYMAAGPNGAVLEATGSPTWPQSAISSNGWIGNVDTGNNIGIFYTTPVGLQEQYGTCTGCSVSPGAPAGTLGITHVVDYALTSYSGEILNNEFSVAVGTQQSGPTLIAQQSPASFMASSSIITNGVFSANAAAYTSSPGYSSASGNPAAPTGWTTSDSNAGVNGPDTGFFGSSGYQPFAPTSTAGVSDFSFLQGKGAFIAQRVATTSGQKYTLAFDAAARGGDPSAALEVILTNTADGTQVITLTPTITDTGFTPFFLSFTAISGSTNVEFLNNSPAGIDDTVDVSNVSLAAVPVPEPATLGLFALGGLGLLLASRKRRAGGGSNRSVTQYSDHLLMGQIGGGIRCIAGILPASKTRQKQAGRLRYRYCSCLRNQVSSMTERSIHGTSSTDLVWTNQT